MHFLKIKKTQKWQEYLEFAIQAKTIKINQRAINNLAKLSWQMKLWPITKFLQGTRMRGKKQRLRRLNSSFATPSNLAFWKIKTNPLNLQRDA